MKETNMASEMKVTEPISGKKAHDLKLQLLEVDQQARLLLEQVNQLKTQANKLNGELKKNLKPKPY
jgi:hypothetical protein